MQKTDFGKILIEHRKENGFTQKEVAEKCNINLRTIQRIESGAVNPRAFTIKTISESLGIDVYKQPNNRLKLKGQFKIRMKANAIFLYLNDLFNLKTNAMRKISILSTFILMTALSFGIISISSAQLRKNKSLKSFENSFVRINDTLYADYTETTNFEYKAFIEDLNKNQKTDLYELYQYDSSLWISTFPTTRPINFFVNYYYSSTFNKYPVVNISFEAANAYCNWLTRNYNSTKKRKFKEVIFRLPSEQEWQIISAPLPGNRLPWYGNSPYDPESLNSKDDIKSLANIKIFDKSTGQDKYSFDGGMWTLPVGVYGKNPMGVYDIIGNVCEMTLDGKVKGGSWDNYIEACYIDSTQIYKAPDPRVGFRVVMIILEK